MPIWKEKKEKLKDKMSATRAKHNCECRLDGIGTGVSALMMGGVCDEVFCCKNEKGNLLGCVCCG